MCDITHRRQHQLTLLCRHSYAFAPASVVAPLGTVALIANCFIAPVMLKEKFRKKDIIGITLSIAGAVIVVLSGKSQNRSVSTDAGKQANWLSMRSVVAKRSPRCYIADGIHYICVNCIWTHCVGLGLH